MFIKLFNRIPIASYYFFLTTNILNCVYHEIQVIYKSDTPNATEALWTSLAPKILKI